MFESQYYFALDTGIRQKSIVAGNSFRELNGPDR